MTKTDTYPEIITRILEQTSMAHILEAGQIEGRERPMRRHEAQEALMDAHRYGAKIEEVKPGVFRVDVDGNVAVVAFSDNPADTHGIL